MSAEFKQIRYSKDGGPVNEDKNIEIPQITEKDYEDRLKEIKETYRVIRDSRTGRAFEIALVNASHVSNGAILMPSTMFSSLTQNVGNAVELAAHGAALPEVARVYVAFPGNGGSDSLSTQDRQYLAQTGRFTYENGQPLSSISALVSALDDHDIPIRSISANVEAGRLGLGLLAALPMKSVTSIYLNGLPGISHDEEFVPVMIKVDHKGQDERGSENDEEEYKVSDRRCEEAKAMLPGIYQGVSHGTRLLSTYLRAFPNQLAYRKAFSLYNDLRLTASHAVFQDTLAALKRQENANITFQFGEFSELHNLEMCEEFGQKLAEALCRTSYQGRMQLFIYPGGLDFHTAAPSRRWALEASALMIE